MNIRCHPNQPPPPPLKPPSPYPFSYPLRQQILFEDNVTETKNIGPNFLVHVLLVSEDPSS